MDNEEYFDPQGKKGLGFGKGVAVGALSMLLVASLAVGGIWLGVRARSQKIGRAHV